MKQKYTGQLSVDMTKMYDVFYTIHYPFRSYYYPRVSGLERQAKCEDPEYQRNPINNSIYDPFIIYFDDYFDSKTEDQITPVNTFYPHGTVCYVDKSGG